MKNKTIYFDFPTKWIVRFLKPQFLITDAFGLSSKISNGSITSLVCFKTAVEVDILEKHLKIDPTLISILGHLL
jgi:hypothetical protein